MSRLLGARWRAVIDEFPDRLLIGEIYLPIERLVAYYGEDLRGLHLPFNFALLETQWNARATSECRGIFAGRSLCAASSASVSADGRLRCAENIM